MGGSLFFEDCCFDCMICIPPFSFIFPAFSSFLYTFSNAYEAHLYANIESPPLFKDFMPVSKLFDPFN